MNPQFSFHIPEDEEDWDAVDRVFPNGRRIQAPIKEIIKCEDVNGLRSYKLQKLASLDCGCVALLKEAYFCFNPECQKVVCYRHAAGPCVACGKTSFCSMCIITAVDYSGKVIGLLCKPCFEQRTLSILTKLARFIWKKITS